MKKFYILLLSFVMLTVEMVNAQSDSHFSLFEYSQCLYNPGATGGNNSICATILHRQQWVGFGEGRPQTTVVSFDMPLKKVFGLGLNFNKDQIGFQNDLYVSFNGAYRLELPDVGTLGMGLGLGIVNRAIDGDWVTSESLSGGTVYIDPTIPHTESVTALDINLGATLIGDNYWVGLSSTHINAPKLKYDVDKPSSLARHFYLSGGYTYSLPNPSFDLIGSGLFQSDISSLEMQFNAKLLYNKKFWGGISYRYTDAIVPMIGMHLLNGLSFGYSYDILITKVGSRSSGSHEVMFRYCFDIGRGGSPGKYRSVRRL